MQLKFLIPPARSEAGFCGRADRREIARRLSVRIFQAQASVIKRKEMVKICFQKCERNSRFPTEFKQTGCLGQNIALMFLFISRSPPFLSKSRHFWMLSFLLILVSSVGLCVAFSIQHEVKLRRPTIPKQQIFLQVCALQRIGLSTWSSTVMQSGVCVRTLHLPNPVT